MSDINMTPLIDVMLVLLVIFMITAPLMTSSLKLDLPQDRRRPAERHAAVHRRRARPRRPLLLGDEAVDAGAFAAGRRARREEERADRSAAARRQVGAVRTRRRADRDRPEGRADADRLRRRAEK
jgi:biopolymer transport protein ExbD/biopolymer transport protein TolR